MSDLIRSLRHGGQPALVAAKQLLQKKVKLTPAEAAEVKLLLPQLKDLFGAKLSEGLSTMLSGHEVAVPVPAELLKPDLSKVKEGAQLPGRFATDLQLVRPQLVNHPGLTREDKATRLFGFLLPFLERVITLPPEQQAEIVPQLLEHVEQAGFAQLKDVPTGRDGVVVAEHLLEAKTPEQLREQAKPLKLDAPTWPETEPRAAAEEQPAPHAEPKQPEAQRDPPRPGAQTQAPARPNPEAPRTEAPRTEAKEPTPERAPVTASQQNVTARGEVPAGLQQRDEAREAPAAPEPSRTNKRLGGRMLWNVLHLFRDDGAQGRESAAQRDEMNRLAVGMALALALLTLIAILLFGTRAFGGAPTVDWSVFPEGRTSFTVSTVNNRKGSTSVTTHTVTRKGTEIDVEVKFISNFVHKKKESAANYHAATLKEPAVDGDARFALRCTKTRLRVHSEDMTFLYPSEPECEGQRMKATSKKPRTVDALSCHVIDTDSTLTFVPGRSIGSFFEDNDCSTSEGLRFISD